MQNPPICTEHGGVCTNTCSLHVFGARWIKPHDHRVYTSAEEWFIAERPIVGQEGAIKYSWSNLPVDMTLTQLAAYIRARWPIAQFYEDAKQTCGLGDYQGRRWDGLHRHIAFVMLAYSFLVQQRMTGPERQAGAFSPCGAAAIIPVRPSCRAPLVTPGSRTVVGCDQPDFGVTVTSLLID